MIDNSSHVIVQNFHLQYPDKLRIRADGRKRSALEAEEDHANFVKINLAYSVLSKRESRVEYDLGLAGDRLDPASNYKGETTTRYYKPANFEERANIYGYYQDPRYNFQNPRLFPIWNGNFP